MAAPPQQGGGEEPMVRVFQFRATTPQASSVEASNNESARTTPDSVPRIVVAGAAASASVAAVATAPAPAATNPAGPTNVTTPAEPTSTALAFSDAPDVGKTPQQHEPTSASQTLTMT